jgi:hypothetical protein
MLPALLSFISTDICSLTEKIDTGNSRDDLEYERCLVILGSVATFWRLLSYVSFMFASSAFHSFVTYIRIRARVWTPYTAIKYSEPVPRA